MKINGYEIEVRFIKKKVKRTSIRVKQNEIIITSFRKMNNDEIYSLININMNFIKKTLEKLNYNNILDDEEEIFGKIYKIVYDDNCVKLIDNEDIYEYKDINDLYSKQYLKLQDIFNEVNRRLFPNIKCSLIIKRMISRWGVCYVKKNKIGLSTYLVHLPVHLIEYVIIHEFCHFAYPNHSKDFYNCVFKYKKNYKSDVSELKKYSHVFNRVL